MVQSRNKGSSAEREVAYILKEWWRKVDENCEFVRTPLSGGWSTSDVRGNFRVSGDLMTTSKLFPFVVEVKRRENFDLKNFVEGRKSPIWSWWKQTKLAAEEQLGKDDSTIYDVKIPMLFFRKSRKPWYLVTNRIVGKYLVGGNDRYDEDPMKFLESMGYTYINANHVCENVICIREDHFFTLIPGNVLNLVKILQGLMEKLDKKSNVGKSCIR
jgi:hypothetical protein